MSELTEEQRALLVASRDYETMIESPGWKRLYQWMEANVDFAVEQMDKPITDPMVSHTLQIAWRERKRFKEAIDEEIRAAINARRAIVEEELLSQGATVEQIDEIIEQEKLVHG